MQICRTLCTKLVKVNEVLKLLKNDEQIEMYFVRNGANRNWYVILTGPFFKMIQTSEEEKKWKIEIFRCSEEAPCWWSAYKSIYYRALWLLSSHLHTKKKNRILSPSPCTVFNVHRNKIGISHIRTYIYELFVHC